jgi:uncharacterized protein involved in exopolysaccharide biosynthesis
MSDEITLKDLCQSFWKARVWMFLGLVISMIAAFLFLQLVTPEYKAEMIVAPADGYALGDYASAVENDRIAAMPFWRPKDSEGASTDFYRFMHTLRGPAASGILIKDESALEGINQDSDKKVSTPEELSVYLEKHVRIDPIGASPLRRISYYHPDQEFAAALLRKIHLVADQMIRRDRRRQSDSRIEYLQNALRRTTNPDHRKGITNLLMQQEHIKMLADLNEAYAAIIVEPPSSSPRPDWPNKPLTWLVAAFLGLMMGYAGRALFKDDDEA